jgi:hypothetical protein
VYKNTKLRKLLVRAIFNDPTDVPNYRPDVDQYPIDAAMENDIVEVISTDLMRKMVKTPDVISDSQDTIPNKPQ